MQKKITQEDSHNEVKDSSVAAESAIILGDALGGSLRLNSPPSGFTPLGDQIRVAGIDPSQIPQTMAELGELISYTYDLTINRAIELNIPVVGSVSGGINRRVVILEWTRYKALFDEAQVEHRYGYVIRFCVTVSKWDFQGNVSLPFLSAQAELGNIQASWMMQVRGLTGQKIDSVVLPPQELNVETFIIAKQRLEAMIEAIHDPTTRFVPGILLSKIDPNSQETTYYHSAVKAFALFNLQRGRTSAESQARLGAMDPAANDIITEVYSFFGIQDPQTKPNNAARDSARKILGGISADV